MVLINYETICFKAASWEGFFPLFYLECDFTVNLLIDFMNSKPNKSEMFNMDPSNSANATNTPSTTTKENLTPNKPNKIRRISNISNNSGKT